MTMTDEELDLVERGSWPVSANIVALIAQAREANRLRTRLSEVEAENERLTRKYVRCVGCGGSDPLVEGSYCLLCVQEGDRRAE